MPSARSTRRRRSSSRSSSARRSSSASRSASRSVSPASRGRKMYPCPKCTYTAMLKSGLASHMRRFHAKGGARRTSKGRKGRKGRKGTRRGRK